MLRIALKTLAHDRGKLVASLAGVGFATMLVLVQVGLYMGFRQNASAMIRHVGGDVWVTPRSVEVIDNVDTLSAGSRALVAGHPCVERVRGHVQSYAPVRKASGAPDVAIVVGLDPSPGQLLPWSVSRGLPQDLRAPRRVSVDEGDLEKLEVRGDPLRASLVVANTSVRIAVLTRGIKGFTLAPFLFTDAVTARELTGLGAGRAHYWVVQARSPSCVGDLVRWVNQRPDLSAYTAAEFARITEDYWVSRSGVGGAFGFTALLGLFVGAVLVGQTLYAVTKEHLRELATLKAIGASGGEVAAFVAWQAGFLGAVGGAAGTAMAFGLQRALATMSLSVVLSPGVLALGGACVLAMCASASAWSVRAVLGVEAAEVFR